MAAPQNFRTALGGFNREDVAHYLEYLSAKHQTQVNQLTAEVDALRAQLAQQTNGDQAELVASLQAERDALRLQVEELLAAQSAEAPQEPEPVSAVTNSSEELEAYRRAERIEREARERAELVYFQSNSVLTEASAKVDRVSGEITDIADQVMGQLTQLQMAVSSSKQALQDAASIMSTIRPNK